MHHFTANHVVSIDGDHATGEADIALSVELVPHQKTFARLADAPPAAARIL